MGRAAKKVAAPVVGREAITVDGEGKIIAVNSAKKTATVRLEDGKTMEIPWEEVVEKEGKWQVICWQPGERLDELLIDNLKIIQHEDEFCFSLDAVLLAHFATLRQGMAAVDLGAGTGVLGLLLIARGAG